MSIQSSSEPSWVSVAVAPSPADRQVDEMIDDPAGYFVRARRQAERDARGYVSRRVARRLRPARVA